jgi:hypothetical protein
VVLLIEGERKLLEQPGAYVRVFEDFGEGDIWTGNLVAANWSSNRALLVLFFFERRVALLILPK